MFRAILGGVVLCLSASVASAQITTYVAPPRPLAQTPMVAAADSAQRDSVARAAMTNMKTWVDSAAGVVVPPADTAFRVQTITGDTVTMTSVGMVAPNTASPVPFLLATGILGMLLGLMMVRRPRARAQRIDER